MSLATEEAARGYPPMGVNGERTVNVVPDPSFSTIQMMLREIGALKELIEANKGARDSEMVHQKELCWSRFERAERDTAAIQKLLESRIVAVEDGITLAHENEARWPTTLDREITAVKEFFNIQFEIHVEKFTSVYRRFEERDSRFLIAKQDEKVVIDNSFSFQKELNAAHLAATERAIGKSEINFSELIKNQANLLEVSNSDTDRRFEDMKDTLSSLTVQLRAVTVQLSTRADATKETREVQVAKVDNTGMIFAIIGTVLGGIVGFAGLVIAFLAQRG